MQKITTFLWFETQAEEAAKLYTSIFRDAKILNVARAPEGTPGGASKVFSVEFTIEGQTFFAMNGNSHATFNESISLFVSCETQREVDDLWEKLLAGGGRETKCGWLRDRFGVAWQIIPVQLGRMLRDPDPAKAGRVMQAMLQMVKLDIATLEAAYRG